MKKKLLFSLALIVSAFMTFAQKPVNVADKYLDNHTYPFSYVNKFTADGDTVVDNDPSDAMLATNTLKVTVGGVEYDFYRFRKLAGPWQTNLMGEEGNWTGWHVDIQKGANQAIKGTLTLTNGWDGFAPSIENAKVYQTTKAKVPAGNYDFKVNWGQDKSGAKWAFFVVTKGNSLPDTTALVNGEDADVLGYVRLSDSTNIALNIVAEQNLTIGLVASFPESEESGKGYCVAMGSFEIIKMIEGLTNYAELKSSVAEAEKLTEAQYPIGTTGGTYPQEKWDAFVAARTAAKAMLEAENTADPTLPDFVDTNTQAEVDAAIETLKNAIAELNDSFILPFKLSTADNEMWYIVHDRRSPYWYWEMGKADLDGVSVPRLLNTKESEVDESLTSFHFKFVKNPKGAGYLIYNRDYPDLALSISASHSNFIQGAEEPLTSWIITPPVKKHADYYRVCDAANTDHQLNTFRETQGGIIGIYYDGTDDPGNDFFFQRVYKEGEINMTALKKEYGKVFDKSQEQFPTGTQAGNFSQEKWDAFVAARSAAKTMIDKEDTPEAPTEQATVDNAATALKDAFEALLLSMVPPMQFSTADKEYWYIVKDKRNQEGPGRPSYFWKLNNEVGEMSIVADTVSGIDPNNDEAYHFKFVKPADAEANEFLIYNKLESYPNAITYYVDGSVTQIFANFDANNDTVSFIAAKTPAFDKEHYIVYVKGQKTRQLNSDFAHGLITFWNPKGKDDPGNDWMFIPVGTLSVENVSAIDLGIYVSNGMIKSRDNAKLNVYNVSGQKVNALKRLDAGVYIVAVEGKQGAVKVIIK